MFQARSKLLAVIGAAILSLALVVPIAQAREPAAGYEQFKGCPSPEEAPTVSTCFRALVTDGHFQMGSKDVPISNPIELSGGLNTKGQGVGNSPEGGLIPVKQEIPGGIVGITGLDWLVNLLNAEQLKLYAVTELAGTPSTPLFNPMSLPIKVHLINPVLGNNCYIGSSTEPIALKLTTGTTAPPPPNEPITGVKPTPSVNSTTKVQTLKGGTYVDNSFAAPAAKGCGTILLGLIPISLDTLVNAQAGLPSAAGTNETTQDFEAELVASKLVYPPLP